MPRTLPVPRRQLELAVNSLRARFGTTVDRDTIAAEVASAYDSCSTARVREFVPSLVERRVQTRFCARITRGQFAPRTVVTPFGGHVDSDGSLTSTEVQEAMA